ncbi:hypothetical protein AB0469_31745 [Streptomyces sp. NPDC093801]|uniref:hypothetical protein n=1 Tax=Streptomyces sp. NPDC093801 TaxID=3155203 RepID=UPI00344E363B
MTDYPPGPIGAARRAVAAREQHPNGGRHTADTITDDALDELYARIETLEAVAAGNKRHVQFIVPDLENALARAEQAEAERDKACTAFNAKVMELEEAKEDRATLALIFDGFGRLLATSSRDWQPYPVDAWLYAVILGWDCEETVHDGSCTHGALEETAEMHGWDEATIAKARRYRAAVRGLTEPKEPAQ